jgi:hypothetical protein
MRVKLVSTLAVSLVVTAFGATAVPSAFAQDASATTGAAPAAQTKAQEKAARKEARAKKNAELKKLQDAGYNPARRDDTQYPQDIQNAQKKAGIGAGASQ